MASAGLSGNVALRSAGDMMLKKPRPLPAPPPETAASHQTLQLIGYWGVVIAWMATISLMSGEPFSAANTNRYLDPLLRYFFPHLSPAGFALAHTVIRKAAHFCEFF